MPAYSFMPQFVEPIRAGTKGGTIRAPRKAANRGIHSTARQAIGGHAYPQEEIALYCRQRHPSGFLIARKTCLAVEPIWLDFANETIVLGTHPNTARTEEERLHLINALTIIPPDCRADGTLDLFARFDGFESFDQMAEFWRRTHQSEEFPGWHIRWLPLPEAIKPRPVS